MSIFECKFFAHRFIPLFPSEAWYIYHIYKSDRQSDHRIKDGSTIVVDFDLEVIRVEYPNDTSSLGFQFKRQSSSWCQVGTHSRSRWHHFKIDSWKKQIDARDGGSKSAHLLWNWTTEVEMRDASQPGLEPLGSRMGFQTLLGNAQGVPGPLGLHNGSARPNWVSHWGHQIQFQSLKQQWQLV